MRRLFRLRRVFVKYLCLVYVEEVLLYSLLDSFEDDECQVYVDLLVESGCMFGVEFLELVSSVVMVRVCDGKMLVIDGFFVEIKEQFIGFYLVDVCDLNEVICIVEGIFLVRVGSIEVWLVWEL